MFKLLIQKITTDDRGVQATPSPDDVASMVPKEKHDLVLRENARFHILVQDMSRKEGLSYKKVLVSIIGATIVKNKK